MVRIGLVAGCYERTLHGFDIVTGPNGTSSLQASFLMPAHQGSIKSVAGAGPWVASGSTDEVISIMNVDQMAQTMTLHHHDGDINSLGFHSDKFLFSASVDGRVCVFRTSDWTLLATLKGHKEAVHCVSAHPNGRVLITIGKDSTLRIWDLVSAKCALTTKLSTAASLCLWSPDGAHYALVSGSRVDVHSLAASDASSTELLQESPILSCAFLSDSVIATGGADGVIRLFDVKSKSIIHQLKNVGDRVRGLIAVPRELVAESSTLAADSPLRNLPLLASAHSNGHICLWDLDVQQETPISTQRRDARLTCLALTGFVPAAPAPLVASATAPVSKPKATVVAKSVPAIAKSSQSEPAKAVASTAAVATAKPSKLSVQMKVRSDGTVKADVKANNEVSNAAGVKRKAPSQSVVAELKQRDRQGVNVDGVVDFTTGSSAREKREAKQRKHNARKARD